MADTEYTREPCPECGRGEVIDGKCDRCNFVVPAPARPLASLKEAELRAALPSASLGEQRLLQLDTIPTSWELSFGADDEEEQPEWRVHRRHGSVNDREWTLIGTGPTPSAALAAASPASKSAGGGGERAPGVMADGLTCRNCEGTGQVFGHAEDCTDDLCALNGDMHSCVGKVEPCAECASCPLGTSPDQQKGGA
jgi:hypothetical protein